MYYNNFFGRIYVERTPEQCNLNYHHVQKAKENVLWDMHLSEGSDE